MMRFCSGVVTWGLIILYFIALVAFGALCYLDSTGSDIGSHYTPSTLKSVSPSVLKWISYGCWAVAAISALALCIYFKKIQLAVAVLKCASEFVEDVPTVLIVPPFFFLISVGFYLYWVFSAVYIVSTGTIHSDDGGIFADVKMTNGQEGMIAYYVFGLLWNHAFFVALPQFVIISACCIWYFCQADGKNPKSPVSKSLCRGLFLHMGSIAMGSFFIAVIDALKLILEYFEKHMAAAREDNTANCFGKYCLACSNCCLDCFERFVRFINRHAYIQIAMTGESFCKAAEDGFFLALRNSTRFGIVHGIGAIFVFIGQLFITLLSTFIGYLILTKVGDFKENIYSTTVPLLFFVLVSLIIGHTFMSVYGVSADAIIHCFCMDEEIHEYGARHAPKLLRQFVDKHVPQRLMSG